MRDHNDIVYTYSGEDGDEPITWGEFTPSRGIKKSNRHEQAQTHDRCGLTESLRPV